MKRYRAIYSLFLFYLLTVTSFCNATVFEGIPSPDYLDDYQTKHLLKLFVIELKEHEDWHNTLDGIIQIDQSYKAFWSFLSLTLNYLQSAINGETYNINKLKKEFPMMQQMIIDPFSKNLQMLKTAYDYLQQNHELMHIEFPL
ncbi:hypothetical protein [Endozoicomonas sp. Mp262]|uniref:hypothetical protein n=1 Tax=Endozoicomonas sp. Mp262 TaxID=2919499 RepID=UPI0021D9BF21